MAFQIAQDPAADAVLTESPFALLLGMLLDQQYKMEDAFKGGHKLLTRLGHLDPQRIAAMDPEEFREIASQTPAIHRFPASMAAKVQEVARIVSEQYDGDASRIWTEASSGPDLLKRMQALPASASRRRRSSSRSSPSRPVSGPKAGRRPWVPTPRMGTGRSRTWSTASRCRRCGTSSRPPRRASERPTPREERARSVVAKTAPKVKA